MRKLVAIIFMVSSLGLADLSFEEVKQAIGVHHEQITSYEASVTNVISGSFIPY